MKINNSENTGLTFLQRSERKESKGGGISIFLTLCTPTVGSSTSKQSPDSSYCVPSSALGTETEWNMASCLPLLY